VADTGRPSREQLLELKGRSLPIAELLEMFGTRVRNHQTVPMILEALRGVGLDTVPSFTTCGFTAHILVVAQHVVPVPEDEVDEEVVPGTLPQQSFKIGDIPSACAGVDSVRSDALLSAATHMMRQKDYSQLPVIDGVSDLRGVITWSSVAAQYEKGVTPTLTNSMVKYEIPVAEIHQELFPRLPLLQQHGYLLVRDNSGRFAGIITGADITERFYRLARPFFLVGEIESASLCLAPKLTGDPIRALKGASHWSLQG
jgi:hypothetical protein